MKLGKVIMDISKRALTIVTYFYISMGKYCFLNNFHFWLIYGLWDVLNAIWLFWGKYSLLCVCGGGGDKTFYSEWSSRIIAYNFLIIAYNYYIFSLGWFKLTSIKFWWKSLNRWRCCSVFYRIFGMGRSRLL